MPKKENDNKVEKFIIPYTMDWYERQVKGLARFLIKVMIFSWVLFLIWRIIGDSVMNAMDSMKVSLDSTADQFVEFISTDFGAGLVTGVFYTSVIFVVWKVFGDWIRWR